MPIIFVLVLALFQLPVQSGPMSSQRPHVIKARMTCKSVFSCEDAVRLWCGGYGRADGDSDGIPCENVCSSIEEVEAIRAEIGC